MFNLYYKYFSLNHFVGDLYQKLLGRNVLCNMLSSEKNQIQITELCKFKFVQTFKQQNKFLAQHE